MIERLIDTSGALENSIIDDPGRTVMAFTSITIEFKDGKQSKLIVNDTPFPTEGKGANGQGNAPDATGKEPAANVLWGNPKNIVRLATGSSVCVVIGGKKYCV